MTVAAGTTCHLAAAVHLRHPKENQNGGSLWAYAEGMDYLSLHLASLRREIADLRNTNVLHAQQSVHSAVEQAASDVRASRLLQIKQELSTMRDCPPEPRVWWDKVRKPKCAA